MAKKVEKLVRYKSLLVSYSAPPVVQRLVKQVSTSWDSLKFNARTADQAGMIISCLSLFMNKSFDFVAKTPPAAVLLKKAAGVEKGSGTG